MASSFSRPRTWFKLWLWAVATLPASSVALLYGFVLRARLTLGRWPTFSNPDPKDLDFAVHSWLWVGSVLLQFLAAPALLILCVVGWFGWPSERWKIAGAAFLYVGLLLGSVGLSRWDPGGFFEWKMD